MPYIYQENQNNSGGNATAGGVLCFIPSFHIDAETMELLATQDGKYPVVFSVNEQSELILEV